MLKSCSFATRETVFPLAIAGISAFAIYSIRLSSLYSVMGLTLCLFLAAVFTKIKPTHLGLISVAKKVMVILAAVFLIALLFTPNVRAAVITEYYLPPGSTQPYSVTLEPTGPTTYNVWFAEFGSSRIGKKTGANTWQDTIEFQLNGSSPYGIGYEGCSHNRIWFTESGTNRIGVISQEPSDKYLTEFLLIAPADPHGIAVQSNVGGVANTPYVWFAEYARHAIAKLDLNTSAQITEYFLPDSNARPEGVLYVPNSGVWFTEVVGDRIGYLSTSGNRLKEWPLISGSSPHSLSNDSFGNIWFTESGRNRIGRLNPYTNQITEYLIPTSNAQPFGIAVDARGNVWFTEHGTGKVGKFVPGTNVFVEYTRFGGAAWDIQAASDNMIWFSDDAGQRIGRLDPNSATTSATVASVSTASPSSSTATTLGTSTATTTQSNGWTARTTISSSSATTTSTTSYSASETSYIRRTSSQAVFTSYVTQYLPTTVTSTSYGTTTTGTTTITATVTSNLFQTSTLTTTSTQTSYLATTTSTQTVTSTTTVTSTSLTFSLGADIGMANLSLSRGAFLLVPGLVTAGVVGGMDSRGTSAIRRMARRLRWKKLGIALFFVAMLFMMILPSRAAAFTEWNLQYGSTAPYGLAFDDQSPSNLWFAEFSSDRIGRLNPSTSEVREILLPANSRPWGVVFESTRKEVWFTESGSNKIGRITSYGTGSVSEFPLNTIFTAIYSQGPRGLAVQEHVNGTDKPYIWVAEFGASAISRVDPYDVSRITRWSLPLSSGPQSIVYSNEIGVWFTEYTSSRIGNLNPTTGTIREWQVATNSQPWDLAIDAKNNVWYTDAGRNAISRLNPFSGEIIEYLLPSAGSQPYGIAIDSRGWVWFAEHGLNRIGRFVPDDGTFTEFIRPTGVSLWGTAIAPGSNILWFGDDSANRLVRFDSSVGFTTRTTDIFSTASTSKTSTSATVTTTPALISATTIYGDASTTVSFATTTSTTSYQVTETVVLLFTTTTATTTVYTSSTLVVLGTSTSYYTSTSGTQTSTSTITLISTQVSGTTTYATSTSTTTVTTTSTATSVVSTGFMPTGIPGYPIESILAGIGVGAAFLIALSRRKRR